MCKPLVVLLICIISAAVTYANFSFEPDPYRYLFKTWTTREGLLQNTVYWMARDSRGFMWIGTENGLARFDGIRFKRFGKSADKITSLLVSHDERLWIGTHGSGVTCLHLSTGDVTNYSTQNGLPDNFIQAIAVDDQENIWLGSFSNGVIRFKNHTFTSFSTSAGLSHPTVLSLLADAHGNLWIGTERGLNCLRKDQRLVLIGKEGFTDYAVSSLCLDKKGCLWVGTNMGVSRVTLPLIQNKLTPLGILTDSRILSILEDKNGIIWIAADKGLYRLTQGASDAMPYSVQRFALYGAFSEDSLISLYEDDEGLLWFGTEGKGFGNLYPSKFKFYTVHHGLSHPHITAIFQDHWGDIWIGTRCGGLNRFTNGRFTRYSGKEGLSDPRVTAIYGDKDGNIWIGSPVGLHRFRQGRFKKYGISEGLSGSFIRSLYADSSGNLWIGTAGGGIDLLKASQDKFQNYGSGSGLSNLFITSITGDIHGNLWVGTEAGVFRFRDEGFHRISSREDFPNAPISDLYADAEGVLWIAAHGSGLARYHNGNISRCRLRVDPPGFTIYKILEGEWGYLWLSTANGVFCVSKHELSRSAMNKICCPDYYHFHEGGLKTAVFSGAGQPAGWKTNDGSLWLPTVEGITVIPPGKALFNSGLQRQVHIESVAADDHRWDLKTGNPYRFPAGTKKIEFSFIAPEYTDPGLVRYKCRLKGSHYDIIGHLWDDMDEVRVTGSNRMVYRDLQAGRYVFTIDAAGVESSKGDAVEFYIQRTFSETPWFYLLFFIFGLFVVAGIFWFLKRWWEGKVMTSIWSNDGKYQTLLLSNRESKKYLRKIIDVMEKEKLYLDPEMTLAKLAQRLDISKEAISQVINRELHQNFNTFLNRYRVNEAKEKLRNPKENRFVVLKIAHDVGFNSKSSFNAIFKSMTGLSPTEYRNKYQQKE